MRKHALIFAVFAVVLTLAVVPTTILVLRVFHIAEPFLHFFVLGPARAASRSREALPSVSIESARTVYCRMEDCDFRFPLPDDASVARIEPVSGGFDTIKGALYVTNADGGSVDLQAYAVLLRKHHFNVQPGFSSEADPPWVGAPAKRNHPKDYRIPFAASTKDGGWVAVDVIDHTTKIAFSYFGDY
jgi:hypothetical protein